MKEYEKFCSEVESDLGRPLNKKELDFLSWLYARHVKEREWKNTLSKT